jgi:hypothetical protein
LNLLDADSKSVIERATGLAVLQSGQQWSTTAAARQCTGVVQLISDPKRLGLAIYLAAGAASGAASNGIQGVGTSFRSAQISLARAEPLCV